MRSKIVTIIGILLLLGAFTQASAQDQPALRLRVRDLDDRGVVGVRFVLRDARDHAQTVQTGADGRAVLTGLVGASVRIVEAHLADAQRLTMDENDPAGGLRIPLRTDGDQVVDFRLTDDLLFVEPAAVTDGPIPTELAQLAQTRVSVTPTPSATTVPRLVGEQSKPAASTPRAWSPWWYAAWALPLLPLAVGWLQGRSRRRPR